MVEEYNSIMQNGVWEIVPRPIDRAVVGSSWIFKIKHGADGRIEKYKARSWPRSSLKRRELTMRKHSH